MNKIVTFHEIGYVARGFWKRKWRFMCHTCHERGTKFGSLDFAKAEAAAHVSEMLTLSLIAQEKKKK